MFKDIISKPLYEVVDRTVVLGSKDKPSNTQHPVYHMQVYRSLLDLRSNGHRRYTTWVPERSNGERLWCAFDTCNGCYGESHGKLWMFGFTTRADARAYLAHLARQREAGGSVIDLSPIFSLWPK